MKLTRFTFENEAVWTLLLSLAILFVGALGYFIARLLR